MYGDLLDTFPRTGRLRAATAALVIQNLCVTATCGVVTLFLVVKLEGQLKM